MKRFIWVLLSTLWCLSSCVYIGLSSSEIKQHNERIKEQISDFSFENYEGNFYSFPGEEDKIVDFHCQEGHIEFLIATSENLYYFTDTQAYTFSTKTLQESLSLNNEQYDIYVQDIEELISFVQQFDGSSSKQEGRRAVKGEESNPLDEITHYYYGINWKYSDVAGLYFYVTSEGSFLKEIYLTDHAKDGGLGKPHFQIQFTEEPEQSSLKMEYEKKKAMIIQNKKEEKRGQA